MFTLSAPVAGRLHRDAAMRGVAIGRVVAAAVDAHLAAGGGWQDRAGRWVQVKMRVDVDVHRRIVDAADELVVARSVFVETALVRFWDRDREPWDFST